MRYLSVVVIGFGVAVGQAAPAAAMCIDNRSDRNIAYVRGAPFDGMSTYYQGIVGPRKVQCDDLPLRADGKTPMSIYVIDDRGRCEIATGCYYENADDQNVFVGAGAKGCPASFNVSTCATRTQ
jgi:hypothetical protein